MLTLANGFYYDGNWDRNYFDGRGFVVFPNGQEYQGTMKVVIDIFNLWLFCLSL